MSMIGKLSRNGSKSNGWKSNGNHQFWLDMIFYSAKKLEVIFYYY